MLVPLCEGLGFLGRVWRDPQPKKQPVLDLSRSLQQNHLAAEG